MLQCLDLEWQPVNTGRGVNSSNEGSLNALQKAILRESASGDAGREKTVIRPAADAAGQ